MKGIRCTLAVSLLATLIPLAASAGNGIHDQVVNSTSVSTYVLTPGSAAFNGWAAWIQQQQARQDIPQTVHGVGTVTVVTTSASVGSQAVSTVVMTPAGAAPGGPPPTTLPTTGTPGQRIMITNKIRNGGEQVWIFAWEVPSGGSAGGGGWVLTGTGSCGNQNCGIVITNPG